MENAFVFQVASVFDAVVILREDKALFEYYITLLIHDYSLSDSILPDVNSLVDEFRVFPRCDDRITVLKRDGSVPFEVSIFE